MRLDVLRVTCHECVVSGKLAAELISIIEFQPIEEESLVERLDGCGGKVYGPVVIVC